MLHPQASTSGDPRVLTSRDSSPPKLIPPGLADPLPPLLPFMAERGVRGLGAEGGRSSLPTAGSAVKDAEARTSSGAFWAIVSHDCKRLPPEAGVASEDFSPLPAPEASPPPSSAASSRFFFSCSSLCFCSASSLPTSIARVRCGPSRTREPCPPPTFVTFQTTQILPVSLELEPFVEPNGL